MRRVSSLSPLTGALYLQPLDERMERLGVFYARFMDDAFSPEGIGRCGQEHWHLAAHVTRLYEQGADSWPHR
jgi:hypothetical protein